MEYVDQKAFCCTISSIAAPQLCVLEVREIPQFPTHVIVDSQHLVENWGDGAASWWYYAHRGVNHEFMSGTPVSFAELLESPKP